MQDLANRLRGRVQLTSDGLGPYVAAVEDAFGADVDFAQLIKLYGTEQTESRYARAGKPRTSRPTCPPRRWGSPRPARQGPPRPSDRDRSTPVPVRGQVAVAQPPPLGADEYRRHLVDGVHRAPVVARLELGDEAVKVLGRHPVEGADARPLIRRRRRGRARTVLVELLPGVTSNDTAAW